MSSHDQNEADSLTEYLDILANWFESFSEKTFTWFSMVLGGLVIMVICFVSRNNQRRRCRGAVSDSCHKFSLKRMFTKQCPAETSSCANPPSSSNQCLDCLDGSCRAHRRKPKCGNSILRRMVSSFLGTCSPCSSVSLQPPSCRQSRSSCENRDGKRRSCEKLPCKKPSCEKRLCKKPSCEKRVCKKPSCEKRVVCKKPSSENRICKKPSCEKRVVCKKPSCEKRVVCKKPSCEKRVVCKKPSCEKRVVCKKPSFESRVSNKPSCENQTVKISCENLFGKPSACKNPDCKQPPCEKPDCKPPPCENSDCNPPPCENPDCKPQPCENIPCKPPSCENIAGKKTSCENRGSRRPSCENVNCKPPPCENQDCDQPPCENPPPCKKSSCVQLIVTSAMQNPLCNIKHTNSCCSLCCEHQYPDKAKEECPKLHV